MPDLPGTRRKGRCRGIDDVVEGCPAIGGRLPLEGEDRGGQAVRIIDGAARSGQHSPLGRGDVADRRCAGRRIGERRRRDQRRRRREHGFQHTAGVLVDRLDPQGQTLQVSRHPEGRAGCGLVRSGDIDLDDVPEQAIALVHLPVVGHLAGDRSTGIVRIRDAGDRRLHQGADLRRRIVHRH
ncbi:hypothetical protein D9M68_709910 [compost metagenome]